MIGVQQKNIKQTFVRKCTYMRAGLVTLYVNYSINTANSNL